MESNKKIKNEQSKLSAKYAFYMIGLVAIVILALILFGNQLKPLEEPKAIDINYSNQPFLGEESAPVSLIEFGDYKCPVCKNFSDNAVPTILEELVDTGKVKFYYFNNSFINIDSERTAKFAESVYQELGNNMFWNFHDRIYEELPEDTKYEKADYFTEEILINILKEMASVKEVEKVVVNFRSGKSDASLEKDIEYVEQLGVIGTPTIFINGKEFDGSQSIDDLKKAVDKAIEEKNNE
ncbi:MULTISPECIES: thioredoxin domain-containing protein [unclassified Bacillus (in: firmicutes)]|uniref:DsbA family protein n=1 Tax=unclassified Bacillus (in: firmicutes) TaxID=185979 RepID=UPI001BE590EC|nr:MULTISPECIES: thioredoxin domain-containing protein [unclassified Bacillus (in: firmicutes)]MBT2617767.1 thioredoxin domain-containing protein [Bacillus sp. ISL-78]MBT2629582.1 thioredoxin domain-containing protein [Bacillus sp. ISL-101]